MTSIFGGAGDDRNDPQQLQTHPLDLFSVLDGAIEVFQKKDATDPGSEPGHQGKEDQLDFVGIGRLSRENRGVDDAEGGGLVADLHLFGHLGLTHPHLHFFEDPAGRIPFLNQNGQLFFAFGGTAQLVLPFTDHLLKLGTPPLH